MRIETTTASMRAARADLCPAGNGSRKLGLVPTMGALHAGHISLVRACRERCDATVVSIFVNPTQFGPNEDLSKYPRTFDEDCGLLRGEDVDLLFAPPVDEIYPAVGLGSYVDVPSLADRLDGHSRLGHFRGVATVVTKLFHIVSPDVAFFGQKDAAQVAVLRAMVRDLDFALEIEVCPIVREDDGLAMSSRNRYLSNTERMEARALYASLCRVMSSAERGMTDASALRKVWHGYLATAPGVRVDYAEIVDPQTLLPLSDVCDGGLVAVAAWVGGTRLIDNIVLPRRPVAEGER